MPHADRQPVSLPLHLAFHGPIIEWRGPSPFFYVSLPPAEVAQLSQVAAAVSYGWGVVPVEAEVNGVAFRTSLFPRDGGYLLPLKADVRRRAQVALGDEVGVRMIVGAEHER